MPVEKRFSISLDVKQPTSNRDIEVVEGDTGNVLVVTLTDNGQAVDLTDCKVCAVFAKPNGKTAMQDTDGNGLTVAGDGMNEITIELYNTSFSPGMVTCEIQVFSGEDMGTLVTSAQFNFKCRRGIANEDTIQATDEWPLLVGMLQRVAEAEEELAALNEETREATEQADAAAERANTAAENAETVTAAADAAEAERAAAELARVEAEEAREDAEAIRQANESTRQAQEMARQEDTAAAIGAAETATERADTAAERAEQAAAGVFPAHNTTHAADGSDPITPAMIGAAYAPLVVALTLPASGWVDASQTITVEGVKTTSCGDLYSAPTATTEQDDVFDDARIKITAQGTNSITVVCRGDVPTIDLPVEIEVRN